MPPMGMFVFVIGAPIAFICICTATGLSGGACPIEVSVCCV